MPNSKRKSSLVGRTARKQKRLAVAAGVGAAIGAAAALLFSPGTGKQLRKDVQRQGKKAGVVLAKQKTAIEHELHAVVESLPPSARRTLNLAKSKLTKAVVASKGALNSGKYYDMVDRVMREFDHETGELAGDLAYAKKHWKKAFSRIKKHLK